MATLPILINSTDVKRSICFVVVVFDGDDNSAVHHQYRDLCWTEYYSAFALLVSFVPLFLSLLLYDQHDWSDEGLFVDEGYWYY